MFVVKVMGGLSIESTTSSVPAGALQRRRLSLMALLALAEERGLSRELIQSYLWPESDAGRARHALDQLLYAARRELGYDAITSSATDLRLNPAFVRADVWAFDQAVRDERWEDAVGLYVGPVLNGIHLGDGSELERWIDAQRAQREQDLLRGLDALSKAATRRGDAISAVRWRRRQSAADPFSVSVALDLMLALEAADDRAAAIHHAKVYQGIVKRTLEVEPDPAVGALASAIAARGISLGAETGSMLPSSASTSRRHAAALLPEVAGAAAAAPLPTKGRVGRVTTLVVGLTAAVVLAMALRQSRQSLATSQASASAARPIVPSKGQGTASGTPRANQTADPEARMLYLRGRALWEKRTKEPLEQAVVLFRKATERDPGYAAGYAGLAQSYAMLGYFGFAAGDAMFPKAQAAALRAIELDPAAGDAYAALGQALAWQHAWSEAEAAYSRALELSPADATAHQWYALLLAYLGRAREAAVHTDHASRLDPLSVQVNNMHGMMLYYAGDLDGAMQQYERTVDAEPDSAWVRRNPWVLTNFSRVAAAAGQHALAVRLGERAVAVAPSHPRPLLDLAYAYAAAGKLDSARAAFARADTTHPHYAVYRALTHGLLDERDEAFAWFALAREWPLPSLVTLNCEPRLAELRADPRFARIRDALKLPTSR
jgi:DNA-binding SARP family transcriptional activator/Tfp pilus assembly protein PilF